MKSLIITDLHHEHPKDLVERALQVGIEKIVCLGDIETPKILRYLLDLKAEKRIIIGDHEFHHCYAMNIHSQSMRQDCEYYQDLWEDNPQEQDFVKKYGKVINKSLQLKKGSKVLDEANGKNLCYVHGSLIERLKENFLLNGIMWGRMARDYSNEFKIANFEIMKKENIFVLFRGHDHCNEIYSVNPENITSGNIKIERGLYGQSRVLEPKKIHIVSVGALENGHCAIFNEETFEIKFANEYSP